MKQHFQIPWAQILIVCAALVMAFGMGGSVQVEQEAVGQREAFRRSLQMLDQYLCALSEDLGDPDILALEAPLEDDRIQENLVRVRGPLLPSNRTMSPTPGERLPRIPTCISISWH